MRHLYPMAALTACSALVFTGCIDNSYDLSDIDTTTQLRFNNLVLPIQMDPILLSDIIEIKEGDQIQEVTINGSTFYAVKEEGDFSSDPVNINSFNASPSNMTPEHAEFQAVSSASGSKKHKAGEYTRIYSLADRVEKPFQYTSDDVDDAIHDIYLLDFLPLQLKINLRMQGVSHSIPSELSDIRLRIPQGLNVTNITAPGYTYNSADYNPNDGTLRISRADIINGHADIIIMDNAVDLRYPEHAGTFDYATHTFDFSSELTLSHADLIFSPDAGQLASLPATVIFDLDYHLNDIETTEMLGEIEYHIDGNDLKIDPISLDDLPEFLAGDQTNITLYNPQIYLNLNNPVAEQGLVYTSGLDIKAINRDGSCRGNFPLNAFTVPYDNGYGPYKFMLAPDPDNVSNIPADYAGAIHKVVYPDLGGILAGNGLPDKLDLELVNPMIPLQQMTGKIRLGEDLEMMSGTYLFLAPLALVGNQNGGSVVYYTEKNDGWDNEDIEDMQFEEINITAVASSTLPYSARLSIHPLDINGRRIDAQVSEVVLPANARNVDISCAITGNVTGLDGIEYVAIVRPDGSNEPLSPGQNITLDKIRFKATGSYTKEF